MPPVVAWLFAVVWLLIWQFFARATWRGIRMARASRAWPSVPGRVLRAELAERLQPSGSGRSGGSRRLYRVRLRYAYEVGGQRLTGSSRHVTEEAGQTSWTSRARAEAELSAFAAGAALRVFHDPREPARAALEVGARPRDWALFLLTVGLCALAPFLLWFGLVLLAPGRLGPPS